MTATIINPSTEGTVKEIILSADQIAANAFLAAKAAAAPVAPAPAPSKREKTETITLDGITSTPSIIPTTTAAIIAAAPAKVNMMTVNHQQVPVAGNRRDDCYGCLPQDTPHREKVNAVWAMTWDDATLANPIYVCKACGRQVPRKIRSAK